MEVDLGILNAGWFFDPDYEWGVASSPIIYKDMVIVQADIQKESYRRGLSPEGREAGLEDDAR